MIGLVLVTHGKLADEFLRAVEHVVGPQENFLTVSVGPDDNIEERREDIIDAIDQVKDHSGVIILTDMFGGTPSNLSISLMQEGEVEVIAGVNLPMLIKLASMRHTHDMSLDDALRVAQKAGRKYINVPSMVFYE